MRTAIKELAVAYALPAALNLRIIFCETLNAITWQNSISFLDQNPVTEFLKKVGKGLVLNKFNVPLSRLSMSFVA